MEATYCTKAIILARQPFRERDSRAVVYTKDKGKLELVARGTKNISSKLAGHLEPVSLSNIMIIKGRQLDYIGSADSENCFSVIKSDLDRIKAAGQSINVFNRLIKPSQADKELFTLLLWFLNILNTKQLTSDFNLLYHFFILKLLTLLGYKPELYHCVMCKKRILPQGNSFDLSRGGLVCNNCHKSKHSLTVSGDCIKVLRLVTDKKLNDVARFKINNILEKKVCNIISSFLSYNFY